jgi:hypothetical protein
MATSNNASGLGPQAGKGSSGLAQSGGRATTFTGGTGGVPLSKNVTNGAVEGTNVNGVGLTYNVRSAGGDRTSIPSRATVGGTPPQNTGGLQQPIQNLRKILPPWKAGSQGA